MPAYSVERSTLIQASDQDIWQQIRDFANWPAWSPWLKMEPSAQVDVHGTAGQVGHNYNWSGELVGAGSMEITDVGATSQEMDLQFLKPFRSQSKVNFRVQPHGDGQHQVTWRMDGKMPFFLFFMIKNMQAFIGMDFERGLRMMKELVETGQVHSQTRIEGIVDLPARYYIGVEASCSMAEIGASMQETIPRAHQLTCDSGATVAGPPAAAYPKVDIPTQQCTYIAYVPVTEPTKVDGATCGTYEASRALKVVHTGSYQNLGNAWGAGMAQLRYKKWKAHKQNCPFEVYLSDPGETPESEIVTEVYLPLR